jgi:hypothetical protein
MLGLDNNDDCVKFTQENLNTHTADIDHRIKILSQFGDIFTISKIDKDGWSLFTNVALSFCGSFKMLWLGLTKDGGPSRFFIMDFESNGTNVLSFMMSVCSIRIDYC